MYFLYFCLSVWFLASSSPVLGGEGIHVRSHSQQPSFLHLTAASQPPTSIRNIRAHRHKKYTRVVLDLTHPINPPPKDHRTATEFQLELPNTQLLKEAAAKPTANSFPLTIHLSTTKSGATLLSLPIEGWKSYKWYLLQNPARVVLDLYPALPGAVTAKAPPKSPQASSSPPRVKSPPPPVAVAKKEFLLVIDPGHGGKDPGALGRKGTREKDVVLNIANYLRDLFLQDSTMKVLMTRETDVFVELEDRAKLANTHKADLFVSIHINSHPQASVKGLELYHFGEASDPRALAVAARENGTPLEKDAPPWQFILADKLNDKKIDDSRELAWTTQKTLMNYLNSFYKIKDHGVKTAPFFVLRMTTMPAILAEIAFISNPTEEKLLQSPTYQKRIAKGIFSGLQSYITPLQTASR